MRKLIKVLRDYAEDFLIGAGIICINLATFAWSTIAGIYCLGMSLLTLGFVLARHPPGRR